MQQKDYSNTSLVEIGGAWKRKTRKTGNRYLSLSIDVTLPSIQKAIRAAIKSNNGKLYLNIFTNRFHQDGEPTPHKRVMINITTDKQQFYNNVKDERDLAKAAN